MTTSLKVLIKNASAPIQYCAFGYVEAGGLGVPPAGYTEVDLADLGDQIPKNWIFRKIQTPAQRMATEFAKLDAAHRAAFYGTRAAMNSALEAGDIEAARLILADTAVPAELQTIKDGLAAILNEQ